MAGLHNTAIQDMNRPTSLLEGENSLQVFADYWEAIHRIEEPSIRCDPSGSLAASLGGLNGCLYSIQQ